MRINTVDRRSVEVEKLDDKICLVIYWKDKRLASLKFEKMNALKVIGELNASIGFERDNPGQK